MQRKVVDEKFGEEAALDSDLKASAQRLRQDLRQEEAEPDSFISWKRRKHKQLRPQHRFNSQVISNLRHDDKKTLEAGHEDQERMRSHSQQDLPLSVQNDQHRPRDEDQHKYLAVVKNSRLRNVSHTKDEMS